MGIGDFRIAAALRSFPFSLGFEVGGFLMHSPSTFSERSGWGFVEVLLWRFLSF